MFSSHRALLCGGGLFLAVLMGLLLKQDVFATLVARLILHAQALGYQVAFGEAWRTPRQAQWNAEQGIGIAQSLHTQRLAIDLLLFKDGAYLIKSEEYRALGEWWEQQSLPGRTCCWGGRFPSADGDHFSLEHEGVR